MPGAHTRLRGDFRTKRIVRTLARRTRTISIVPHEPAPPLRGMNMHRHPLLTALVPSILAAAAAGVETPRIDIHGFVSQGYLKTSANNYLGQTQHGSFAFNEAAVNAQSQLADDLHVGVQLFARDLGGIGNDRVGVDWAFLDYRWRDELG